MLANLFYVNKRKYKIKLVGDALITNKKNIVLGILTADCAPIIIYDPKLKIISAIHYEALKLWIKGIKLVKKNLKIKNNTSYEN